MKFKFEVQNKGKSCEISLRVTICVLLLLFVPMRVWLKFADKEEPFRVELDSNCSVAYIQQMLLDNHMDAFSSPKPAHTYDIKLIHNNVPLSPCDPVAPLADNPLPVSIINLKASVTVESIETATRNISLSKPEAPMLTIKFTVTGSINQPEAEGSFFVEPDNDKLISAIRSKSYIMLTGHRGSGKTTCCWHAINKQLQEFTILWTTFQGVDATTPQKFWESYGSHIKRQCSSTLWAPNQLDIVNADTFLEFFRFHSGKKIVLFMDEFDLLLSNQAALESLYNTLHSIKDQRTDTYGLQSLVPIGPYNIIRYDHQSPFNNHLVIPYFSINQVQQLFQHFVNYSGATLKPGIVDKIYAITKGHPGMVCFCGKVIQEKLLLTSNTLTMHKWVTYEMFELRTDISVGWRTVAAIAAKVKRPEFANFLIRNLLSTSEGILYDEGDSIQLELIGIGALSLIGDKIEIPSPLVRAILLKSVTDSRKRHINMLPVSNRTGLLDVPKLIRSIYYFDHARMREAPLISRKRNETSGADVKLGYMVPHEQTYKVELFQLLTDSLPGMFGLTVDMNGPNSSRADIVVSCNDRRVVVGLVAHERDGPEDRNGTVLEHIDRCTTMYSQIEGVEEMWVVNFTTRKPEYGLEGYGYAWPPVERDREGEEGESDSVQVIHVWHDLEWTQAMITERRQLQQKQWTFNVTKIVL